MKHYQGFIGAVLKPFGIKYPQKKRSQVKRTWLDVLLRRPGKPTNLSSSAPTSSIPQFNSKPNGSRPSGNAHPTRTQTTTGGGNDLHLDIANLDFLDPAEARKQARISAYTRPGRATRSPVSPKGRAVLRSSMESSIHRSSGEMDRSSGVEEESSDITDEKVNYEKSEVAGETSTPEQEQEPPQEIDLEAQEEAHQLEMQQARRREILEKNPELTEEVTF